MIFNVISMGGVFSVYVGDKVTLPSFGRDGVIKAIATYGEGDGIIVLVDHGPDFDGHDGYVLSNSEIILGGENLPLPTRTGYWYMESDVHHVS